MNGTSSGAKQKRGVRGRGLHRRNTAPRRGAAALEMALTVTILIVFAGACLDLGRFAYTYIAVSSACSEGAAYGCLVTPTSFPDDAAWRAAIQERAARETTGLRPPLVAADFVVELRQETGHDHVCVRVSTEVPFNLLVVWPWLPTTLHCQGLAAMPPMP